MEIEGWRISKIILRFKLKIRLVITKRYKIIIIAIIILIIIIVAIIIKKKKTN
jgi:hypothetical protein